MIKREVLKTNVVRRRIRSLQQSLTELQRAKADLQERNLDVDALRERLQEALEELTDVQDQIAEHEADIKNRDYQFTHVKREQQILLEELTTKNRDLEQLIAFRKSSDLNLRQRFRGLIHNECQNFLKIHKVHSKNEDGMVMIPEASLDDFNTKLEGILEDIIPASIFKYANLPHALEELQNHFNARLLGRAGSDACSRSLKVQFQNPSFIKAKEIAEIFQSDADSLTVQRLYDIYQVVFEALNNVAKHANATEAIITIDIIEDLFIVSVNDDGTGLLTENSSGMRDMKNRAEDIGGTIEWTVGTSSERGTGTSVVLTVPIRS